MDSKFMTTALRGTSTDRNTTMRRRNDRASTAAKNHGMRWAR